MKDSGISVTGNPPANGLLPKIVKDSIDSVKPSVLFEQGFHLCEDKLEAFGKEFDLSGRKKIKCVAIGKSAEAMAYEVEKRLGDRVVGIIATPIDRHLDERRFHFFKTGHPFPDDGSVKAAGEIQTFVSSSTGQDLLLFLISGGGSAASFLPVNGVTLSEVNETLRILFDNGIPIDKINLVRRHLSLLAGGKLAALSKEAEKISLIISDVVGNDTSNIASGPTVRDWSTPGDAYNFLDESGLINKIPSSVPQTFTKLNETFSRIILRDDFVKIIGSNNKAVKAAESTGIEKGFKTLILTRLVNLSTEVAAELLISVARSIEIEGMQIPLLILLAGETTVKVKGTGNGGRNQQLMLETLCKLAELAVQEVFLANTSFFSFGTDGKDGNSDAAGAFVSADILKNVRGGLQEIKEYISKNDSNSFFKKYGGLITTGPTDTNVMDIMGIIAE